MLDQLIKNVYENAVRKGLWEKPLTFAEFIDRCKEELYEAVLEFENGNSYNNIYLVCGKPEGIPIELADVIILIFSFCCKYGIEIEKAINMKHQYNTTRPYKHGKPI